MNYQQRQDRLVLRTYWPGTPRDDVEVSLRDLMTEERLAGVYGDMAAPYPHPGTPEEGNYE